MMKFTEAQMMMIEDGLPAELIKTAEERKAYWEANPPKAMPAFNIVKNQDAATIKLLAEFEAEKKVKAKNRIAKMLSKKEDHTGQRWDTMRSRWVDEDDFKRKAMIVITTNTRGATKMKDYAEMSMTELVEVYNKKSGKPPIKKFRDKAAGLAAMAKLATEAKAAKPKPAAKSATATEEKAVSENKLAAEFKVRVGTNLEKLVIAFDENFKKMVSQINLAKAVYGSKNIENIGALGGVIKGVEVRIEKNHLPYTLKKEKNESKEISYGLFPK